jgi:hypothetical protein
MEKYHGNTVEYWKQNAEEDYIKTPISVLKYITVLEEQAEQLRINDVVGRSEQLLAFKKWEAEKCKLPWDASPEQIIEQYLSQ